MNNLNISKILEQTFKPGYKIKAMVSRQFIDEYYKNPNYKHFFTEDPTDQDRTQHGWADFLVIQNDGEKVWFRVAQAGKDYSNQRNILNYHKAHTLDYRHQWLIMDENKYVFASFAATKNIWWELQWSEIKGNRVNNVMANEVNFLSRYIRKNDVTASKDKPSATWKKKVRVWLKNNSDKKDFPKKWQYYEIEYAKEYLKGGNK